MKYKSTNILNEENKYKFNVCQICKYNSQNRQLI